MTDFLKILKAGNREKLLRGLARKRLLEKVLPEVTALKGVPQRKDKHPEGDVFEHTMRVVGALPSSASLELVVAALLHDIGKAYTLGFKGDIPTAYGHEKVSVKLLDKILNRIDPDKKVNHKYIECLVANHMRMHVVPEMREKSACIEVGTVF